MVYSLVTYLRGRLRTDRISNFLPGSLNVHPSLPFFIVFTAVSPQSDCTWRRGKIDTEQFCVSKVYRDTVVERLVLATWSKE